MEEKEQKGRSIQLSKQNMKRMPGTEKHFTELRS
jgi:hypothetical protein